MINTTMSVKISSLKETLGNKDGVLICQGNINFQYYSKENVEETMPFRSKGTAAVALAGAGVGKSGIAIGYLDLQVVDTDKGYKQKICTFVIRNFIPTVGTSHPEVLEAIPEVPQTAVPVLVGATASNNGKTAITDLDSIPF